MPPGVEFVTAVVSLAKNFSDRQTERVCKRERKREGLHGHKIARNDYAFQISLLSQRILRLIVAVRNRFFTQFESRQRTTERLGLSSACKGRKKYSPTIEFDERIYLASVIERLYLIERKSDQYVDIFYLSEIKIISINTCRQLFRRE